MSKNLTIAIARNYSKIAFTDRAIEYLQKAININPEYREKAKNDSYFDTLREEERFKKLVDRT